MRGERCELDGRVVLGKGMLANLVWTYVLRGQFGPMFWGAHRDATEEDLRFPLRLVEFPSMLSVRDRGRMRSRSRWQRLDIRRKGGDSGEISSALEVAHNGELVTTGWPAAR